MRAWTDDKRDELAETFPSHDIWFVPGYGGHVTWCSRPKGYPIATINRGSAGDLEEAIAEELARMAGQRSRRMSEVMRTWLYDARVAGFGMVYSDEQIARVVHAANAELQAIQGDPAPSQPWDHEPQEIRDNITLGVRNARNGMTPEEHHESWRRDKIRTGWRFGPSKDSQAKTHPCLVPFGQLPFDQRVKNVLFIAIVRAMWAEETPD